MSSEFKKVRTEEEAETLYIEKQKDIPFDKTMVEATANFLEDSVHELSEESLVPEELRILSREISDVLQYVVNCSSWNMNRTMQFDIQEIKSRINSITL